MSGNSKQPYKILWYSLPCLIDSSNGAAISNKYILEQLVAQGMQVKALNATIGDSPSGLATLNNITSQVKENPAGFYQFSLDDIEYFVVRTKSTELTKIQADEQSTVMSVFIKLLEQFQPDIVIGFCPDLFSLSLRHEAKVRGIATAYTVCNASHDNFSFPDCDVVLTNSQAISSFYNRRTSRHTKVDPFGIVIGQDKILGPQDERNPQYITLINPVPYKGIAIFMGLVKAVLKKHPDFPFKFLIVKNRGSYEDIVKSLKKHDGSLFVQNPDVHEILNHIDVAEPTTNMKGVYSLTKILVCPSLCFEAWGMVATEANMNGIPVLAHDHGGLPEAIGRQFIANENGELCPDDSALGGILVKPAQSTMDDYLTIPSEQEIEPYVEALEQLLNNDYSEQCKKSAEVNNPQKNLERFKSFIVPLMDKAQQSKNPLNQSFFLDVSYIKEKHDAQAQSQAQAQARSLIKSNTQGNLKLKLHGSKSKRTKKQAKKNH